MTAKQYKNIVGSVSHGLWVLLPDVRWGSASHRHEWLAISGRVSGQLSIFYLWREIQNPINLLYSPYNLVMMGYSGQIAMCTIPRIPHVYITALTRAVSRWPNLHVIDCRHME